MQELLHKVKLPGFREVKRGSVASVFLNKYCRLEILVRRALQYCSLGAESIGEREAGAVETILSTAGVTTGAVDTCVTPEPYKLAPFPPFNSRGVEFSLHIIPLSLSRRSPYK